MATPKSKVTRTVRFHYIKSADFRVIHVDGALGGPTPTGRGIHISFYSERQAIPRECEYELTDEGKVGKEIEALRVARGGIVRELEVDAMMDFDTAKSLHKWLGERLKQAPKPRRQRK